MRKRSSFFYDIIFLLVCNEKKGEILSNNNTNIALMVISSTFLSSSLLEIQARYLVLGFIYFWSAPELPYYFLQNLAITGGAPMCVPQIQWSILLFSQYHFRLV
jgi:hypothetical protein